MKKKNAFTLAEVLITLAIIGVVAAMTIPSVIVRTNQQEYKTGAKKALSALSSAIQLAEVQDGISLESAWDDTARYIDSITSKLNIIKYKDEESLTFYTADGFRYHWVGPYMFIVDVNGDKGPTNADMDESEWKEAIYDSEDDLYNPEWTNINLSDMFVVEFNPDTGGGIVYPYTHNAAPAPPPGEDF